MSAKQSALFSQNLTISVLDGLAYNIKCGLIATTN